MYRNPVNNDIVVSLVAVGVGWGVVVGWGHLLCGPYWGVPLAPKGHFLRPRVYFLWKTLKIGIFQTKS